MQLTFGQDQGKEDYRGSTTYFSYFQAVPIISSHFHTAILIDPASNYHYHWTRSWNAIYYNN